jgi:hypothetical protein
LVRIPKIVYDDLLAGPEFALVLLHVLAWGALCLRLLKYLRKDTWTTNDPWTTASALLGSGLALLGAEMFVLGEIHALYRMVWFVSSGIAALALRWARPWVRFQTGPVIQSITDAPAEPSENRISNNRIRWLLLPPIITAAIVIVGCFRPAHTSDEWQYHWPAPLLWAQHHGWVASPYRLTNATALAEMLYTIAALFNNPTFAHFISAFFLLLVAAAVGSLATSIKVCPWAAVAAACSIPAMLEFAPAAHNDLLTAAFSIAVYAILLADRRRIPSAPTITLCILLLVAAISVKPFAILIAPGIVLYLLWPMLRDHRALSIEDRFRSIRWALLVSAAVVCTLGVWAVHCRIHSGHWWEQRGMHFATGPDDPLWNSASVAGRHPRPIDFLAMPIGMPLLTTVGPETGQYGSRIGPLLLVFSILAIPGLRWITRENRAKLFWLLGSAFLFLAVLSPVSPKTRFLLFVWLAFAVAAAVGFDWTQRLRRRWAGGLFILFIALSLFGPIDASRHIYSFVTRLSMTKFHHLLQHLPLSH